VCRARHPRACRLPDHRRRAQRQRWRHRQRSEPDDALGLSHRLRAPAFGGRCWRAENLDAKRYDKILISRIVVTLKTDPKKGIDPTDLKMLVDYFHASLEKAFKPQMEIVTAPGPGVLVMRTALTDLVPTDSARSLLGTAVPYGFVAEAGLGVAAGRPSGSTPYLGQTGIELQFADGANGAILGECADTQVGRKYAADLDRGAGNAAQTWASGYLGSFQAWTYAKDAFDK
jgi:hypothetical protein